MIIFENTVYFDSSVSLLICVFMLIHELSQTMQKNTPIRTSFICIAGLLITMIPIIGSSIISHEIFYANAFFSYLFALIGGTICFIILTGTDLQKASYIICCIILCVTIIFRADMLVVWPLFNCITGFNIIESGLQIPITSTITLNLTVCHLIPVVEVLLLLIIVHHAHILNKNDPLPINRISLYTVLFTLIGSIFIDKYLTSFILNTVVRMVFLLQISAVFLIFASIHFHRKAVDASVQAENLKAVDGINTRQMKIMFEQFINASEKHYILNQLQILQAYIESGNTKKAEEYLNDMIPSLHGPGSTGRYTENVFVNAVLNHIHTKWPEIDINMECTAADLSCLNSTEFGMLLVNIIEYRINQIEEHNENMSLNIQIYQFQEMLIITIDGLIFDDRMQRNSFEFASIDNILNSLYGFTDIGDDGNIRFFLPIIPFDIKN